MTEKSDQVSQSKELRDRVAIVTGAGQGMGRGIARCLALAGANVVVAEQANDRIAAVVAQLEDLGVQALGIATDVSRGEDVQTTVRKTVERFGRIDILVNNAGRLVVKPLVEQSEEDWDRVVNVNLKGVLALTRDLAYEVAPLGIRVNAIAPGPIDTPMANIVSDEQRQRIARNIPVGRMGQPEDIGRTVVFLASDAASYITGATLPVSGGADLKVG